MRWGECQRWLFPSDRINWICILTDRCTNGVWSISSTSFFPTILHNLLLIFISRRSHFSLSLWIFVNIVFLSVGLSFCLLFFPFLFLSSKNDLQLKLFYRVFLFAFFFEFMHCCSAEKNICFILFVFSKFRFNFKK